MGDFLFPLLISEKCHKTKRKDVRFLERLTCNPKVSTYALAGGELSVRPPADRCSLGIPDLLLVNPVTFTM